MHSGMQTRGTRGTRDAHSGGLRKSRHQRIRTTRDIPYLLVAFMRMFFSRITASARPWRALLFSRSHTHDVHSFARRDIGSPSHATTDRRPRIMSRLDQFPHIQKEKRSEAASRATNSDEEMTDPPSQDLDTQPSRNDRPRCPWPIQKNVASDSATNLKEMQGPRDALFYSILHPVELFAEPC